MNQPYRLRPLAHSDLDLVLTWRNLPEVRNNMFTRHEITVEEHRAHFARALVDPTKAYFLCESSDGDPVGVVNFVDIDTIHGTATWAFYSGDLQRRGVGSWMELLALDHAFGELGLMKLCGEVLEWNDAVVRFHLRFGFRIEGVFKDQHVRDGERFDVVRIAIFREEWARRRPAMRARLLHRTPEPSPAPGEHYEFPFTVTSDEVRVFMELERGFRVDADASSHERFAGDASTAPDELVAAKLLACVTRAEALHGARIRRQTLEFHGAVATDAPHTLRIDVRRRIAEELTVEVDVRDMTRTLCRSDIDLELRAVAA